MNPAQPPQPVTDWYRFASNETDSSETAHVYLFDAIGGWWGIDVKQFVTEFAALTADEIVVHIHSPGGNVADGVAVLNALRAHPAKVTARVEGLAASAASFIAMGADEILMAPNAEMMIHDALMVAIGNASELTDAVEYLDRVSDNIASVYADRAGGTITHWRDLMKAETWYSADEAVTAGLADKVDKKTTTDTAENAFDMSAFAYASRQQAPGPSAPVTTPAPPKASASPEAAKGYAALAASPHRTSPVMASTPTEERTADMSDALKNGLMHRLGITDSSLDEDALLAAVDEALNEQADPAPAAPAPLPEGVVAVDAEQWSQTQADAALGREAREQQITATRVATVDNAIAAGKIPPARKEHWLNLLEADPGASAVLDSLAAGTVPLTEKGFTGGIDEAENADDRLYVKAWGNDSKGETTNA